MRPEDLRADIPAFEDTTYLNFGASGPSPRRVVDAAETELEHHEYEAPGADGMYPAMVDTLDRVRERVAEFVGAGSEEIALTQSTTDGINRIAGTLDWEPGDVVVRTDLEHSAGILPWQHLDDRRDIEVRTVPSDGGRLDRDAYAAAVEDAKLVCFSALTWNYGTRLPVAELVDIAHDEGALVLVDAVQMPGQMPLDVSAWGADIVAAAGHKWLLGIFGAGFLYIDEAVATELHPRAVGYRSVVEPNAEEYELEAGARRFEVGTVSPAPYAALAEAIETVEAVGLETIRARSQRLAGRLADAVPDDRLLSPANPESGLVTVASDDPEATVERLADRDIVIRSLPEPQAVRASVHAVNTEEDVDRVADALAAEW